MMPDLTERVPAERRASLLASLARSIAVSLDIDTILQTVAEGARELCRSDLSAIALREPETGDMVFRFRAGVRFHDGGRLTVETGRGAGGRVLDTGKPFRSDDLSQEPAFADDDGYREVVKTERIVTVMVVPITIDERIEGLLYVDNRTPRPFTDHDEAILTELADHAAIAIRNVRLLAREHRAREEAEAANRMKDEFLATLSHELRTPLNAVLGWAVTLRTARLDPATSARALEAIERNARAQSQLIEDLLDISRIVSGKLRLEVRIMDPITVVEAAIEAMRPAAASKDLALVATLDPRAGPVWGDPDRLQQVVWNLLSNAIKFTPKGGRVDVRLHQVDASVEIAVSDTGQGIAPSLLPHVFERFRQADSSSTRTQGGLGIGLALVRHLVELHGGTVTAESPGVDQGATFRARLPLVRPSDDDASRPAARRVGATPALTSLGGVRVLVVDDEHDTLEMFDGILAVAGAEVRRATGATLAIETLRQWRPDVIVSDIEMPHENGYAFIRRLRSLPPDAGGTVPAVAVTAYGGVVDRIRVLSAGFQMHVPKPVEPAELVAAVAALAEAARRDPAGP
jgi:signal transduction histidine kinase/ActR/RegA family two-component response regulator